MEKEVKRNAIEYNVFMDPDVEFLDSDDKFPSEYRKETKKERTIIILIISIIIIIFMVFIVEINKNNKTEVAALNGTASTIQVIDVGKYDATPIGNKGFVRFQDFTPVKSEENKPYIIDDYDYTPYNLGKVSLKEVMNEIGYEEPMLLVSTYYNGIIDVIGSRYLYRMHKENGSYIYFLYLPKEEEEVTVNEDYTILNTIIGYDQDGKKFNTYGICFLHGMDIVGENLPIKVHIVYKDGSEDDLEVFVTKEYYS